MDLVKKKEPQFFFLSGPEPQIFFGLLSFRARRAFVLDSYLPRGKSLPSPNLVRNTEHLG